MDPREIAETASAYSHFSGVLAGMAFAGLIVYLSRRAGDGDAADTCGIAVWQVAATLFFSVFSLAVGAFLFASLDGMASFSPRPGEIVPNSTGSLAVNLFSYSIIQALSILCLLYSVTLMVLQYGGTKKMGRYAYWGLAIGGVDMVVVFLGESARGVLTANCVTTELCPHTEYNGILSVPVIWLTALLSTVLVLLFTTAARPSRPEIPRGLAGWLHGKVVAPVVLIFATAVAIEVGSSVYVNTRSPAYEPPTWFIDSWYFGSMLIVAVFAIMFGSVIAPRTDVRMLAQGRHGRAQAGALVTLLLAAVGLAVLIDYLSGQIALWLIAPVAVLTIWFLVSLAAKPRNIPAQPATALPVQLVQPQHFPLPARPRSGK